MGTCRRIIWLAQLLSLCALASTDCVIIKNSTGRFERYTDCSKFYLHGCSRGTRRVEIGPVIYLCSNITSLGVINAQLRTTIENIMLVNKADLGSLEPNNYSWINLTTLYMDNANITSIVPGFFNNFQDLKNLHLTNNVNLEFIIDGAFGSLYKLDKLNLSANAIKTVTDHSFSGLINLKILDLSKNKLSMIPKNIFNFQPLLRHVNFSQNCLVNVNYAFTLPRAKMINLSENQLEEFDFKQLETSVELNVFDISKNYIEDVTNLNFTHLERLNLAFNKIKQLGEIRNVVKLIIGHNNLRNLRNSQFDSVLEYLDLGYNEISQVNTDTFKKVNNLTWLHLEHNNIQTLPAHLLLNQKRLMYFNISHNKIAQIPFGLFTHAKYLNILDVSDNKMVLDFDTLFVLTNLEKFYFQNNNVKNFNAKTILFHFKYLKYVALSDKLWNCIELAKTVHLLEMGEVTILKGNNTKTSNILGISCSDNLESKEEVIQLNNEEQNQDNLTAQPNYNQNYVLKSINKSISDLSANLEILVRSQSKYLNKSVLDMSEQMKASLYSQNYNLSLILLNLKSIFSTKPVALPVSQTKLIETNYETYDNVQLFISNGTLILILSCILCLLYLNIRRLSLMKHVRQIQTQLL